MAETINNEHLSFVKAATVACLEAINNGWTITTGAYLRNNRKQCCAITAIGLMSDGNVVNENITHYDDNTVVDLTKLMTLVRDKTKVNLDSTARMNFICGFDSCKDEGIVDYYTDEDIASPWWQVGQRVACILRSEVLLGEYNG